MPFFCPSCGQGIADKTHKMFLGPMIKSHLEFVEDHLARYEWFAAGRLTAADFQMSFPLEAVVASGMAGKRYPNIQRYVEHYQQRPRLPPRPRGGWSLRLRLKRHHQPPVFMALTM